MAAMPWLSWRTSPKRCIEDVRLFVNPRHWLTWPCSVVFIAVYNKCVILLLKWVTLNAAPCISEPEKKITGSYKILHVQIHTLDISDLTKVCCTIPNIIGLNVINRCVTQTAGHIAVCSLPGIALTTTNFIATNPKSAFFLHFIKVT